MYKKRWFFGLTMPALIVFGLIIFVPTVLGIILSFTDWQIGNKMFEDGWTGFNNYKAAFQDGAFVESIGYTAVFTLVCLVLVNIIGFMFALCLVKAFRGKNFFRGAFFIPNMIGGLVLGYLWKEMFNKLFTDVFNIDSLLLHNRWTAMVAMAMVVAWQMSGYVMIIYIAALQNIDQTLMEASKIEGAGIFRRFRSVTLPGIMPAITVAMFLVLSNSFKLFDQNLSLTNGENGTELLALNTFHSAYNPAIMQTFGIAQAKAVIFTILVSSIALSQVVITKKMEVNA